MAWLRWRCGRHAGACDGVFVVEGEAYDEKVLDVVFADAVEGPEVGVVAAVAVDVVFIERDGFVLLEVEVGKGRRADFGGGGGGGGDGAGSRFDVDEIERMTGFGFRGDIEVVRVGPTVSDIRPVDVLVERMSFDFGKASWPTSEAIFWLHGEKRRDKVDHLDRTWKVDRSRVHVLHQGLRIGRDEWRTAAENVVDKDTQRPQVDREATVPTEEHLWRSIVDRPADRRCQWPFATEHKMEEKVDTSSACGKSSMGHTEWDKGGAVSEGCATWFELLQWRRVRRRHKAVSGVVVGYMVGWFGWWAGGGRRGLDWISLFVLTLC